MYAGSVIAKKTEVLFVAIMCWLYELSNPSTGARISCNLYGPKSKYFHIWSIVLTIETI